MKKLSSLLLLTLLPLATYAQPETFTDGARTTLNEDIDATETGIDLVDASLFPATPTSPGFFKVTLQRVATPTTFEILQCTVKTTNTLTCSRDCASGTCDGSGQTFSTGDYVFHSISAASLIRGLNPAGTAKAVQFNSASIPGGATGVLIDRGNLVIRDQVTQTSTFSSAGLTVQYGPAVSVCPNMPSRFQILGPTSAFTPRTHQPTPYTMPWGFIGGSGGIGTATTLGTAGVLGGYNVSGCTIASNVTPTDTNAGTRRQRFRGASAAAGASSCDVFGFGVTIFRGSTANTGGFFVAIPGFGWNAVSSATRGAVGVMVTNPGNVVNTTLTDVAAFAYELGQTNWHWYVNDSAGAVTDVDLGASFPIGTSNWYDMYIYSAQAGSTIEYCIVRKDSTAVTYGSSSSNLPTNTTWLKPLIHMNTGVTATAVTWEASSIYWETLFSQ